MVDFAESLLCVKPSPTTTTPRKESPLLPVFTIGFLLWTYGTCTLSLLIPLSASCPKTALAGAAVTTLLSALLAVSFAQAVFTSPGTVPLDYHAKASPTAPLIRCEKCRTPKPPRAHHCSKCDRCVLLYDHHCGWINNCVGFHNRKFFILFLLYAQLDSATVFALALPTTFGLESAFALPLRGAALLHITVLCVLCGVLSVGLLGLLAVHTSFLVRNRTTLECILYRKYNPYDRGCVENVRVVCGVRWLLWLLPVHPRMKLDGLTWETDLELAIRQIDSK
eukprot:NODE_3170_length_1033_cov_26.882114_g2913_i0.p1 GENE.NODE_3170_length_1033_cov_26.882114_g2913_i0~~NODE_3170_length_1033_cov_26.882114_g2913_i0.p1  ORF type:complete len:280 (-),score=19.72 NODE_3170_length_1033_cov_26.882114_g2913_i0:23-862(-)